MRGPAPPPRFRARDRHAHSAPARRPRIGASPSRKRVRARLFGSCARSVGVAGGRCYLIAAAGKMSSASSTRRTTLRFRSSPLARYRAPSAAPTRCSRVPPCSGNSTIPKLIVRESRPSWNRCGTSPRSRSATSSAPSASVAGRIRANSSPPSRAIVSTLRIVSWAVRPTAIRTASPAGCPKRSLISLKWSMSASTNATGCAVRRLRSSSSSRRSSKPRRFSCQLLLRGSQTLPVARLPHRAVERR